MSALTDLRGNVLLKVGGAVVVETSGGPADREAGLPNGPGTRFQLASVSKQFTSTAVMLLADRGVLAVTDAVSDWVDDCPDAWRDMTIRHLLTHTSGIGHWNDMPEIDVCAAMDPAEQLDVIKRKPLIGNPGERYYYSSLGYFLLAYIVQRAADRRYAAFLAEEIFTPLDMAATFAGNGSGEPQLAVGYADGEATSSYELDYTGLGAGDVWSTTADMARWDAAVLERRLLSAASWDAALATQVRNEPETSGPLVLEGYGYGWGTGTLADSGALVCLHSGGNAGFRTLNLLIPESQTCLVILCNDEASDVVRLAAEVLAANSA
jgi:CubicO group peptidase (beta-lactamase class C family)